MPLVAHPVRSLWGSQPRCARCVCEWLHRKWDGALHENEILAGGASYAVPKSANELKNSQKSPHTPNTVSSMPSEEVRSLKQTVESVIPLRVI